MEFLNALTRSIMLFFLFTLSSPSYLTRPSNLISETCKKTRNPNLCRHILKVHRKALKAASLLELGKITIDLSKSSAQATKKMISVKRMITTRDNVLKDRYKNCETNYASALYYLKTASYYLNLGAYKEVVKYTAPAVIEPIYCRESFENRGPTEPGWLKEGNERLECLCSVVLVISNRLFGRNESRNVYKV